MSVLAIGIIVRTMEICKTPAQSAEQTLVHIMYIEIETGIRYLTNG